MFRDLKEYQELQKLYESEVSKPEQLDEFTGLGAKKAVQMSKPKPTLTQKDQSDIKKEAGLQKALANKKNLQKIETNTTSGAQSTKTSTPMSTSGAQITTNQRQSRDLAAKNKDVKLNKFSRTQTYGADAKGVKLVPGAKVGQKVNRSTVQTKAEFDFGGIKKGERLGVLTRNQRRKYDLMAAQAAEKAKAKDTTPSPEKKTTTPSPEKKTTTPSPEEKKVTPPTQKKPSFVDRVKSRVGQVKQGISQAAGGVGKVAGAVGSQMADNAVSGAKALGRVGTGYADAATGNLFDFDKRGGKVRGLARVVGGAIDKLTGDRTDLDKRGATPLNKGQKDAPKSENPRIQAFNKKKQDLKTTAKYGSTATIQTQDGKTFKPGDPGYEEQLKKARQTVRNSMKKEAYEPYDIVLEYLLSTEQAATIEEANYIMTEMDAKTIQDIVSQQLNEQN